MACLGGGRAPAPAALGAARGGTASSSAAAPAPRAARGRGAAPALSSGARPATPHAAPAARRAPQPAHRRRGGPARVIEINSASSQQQAAGGPQKEAAENAWSQMSFPTYMKASGKENCESLSSPEIRELKQKFKPDIIDSDDVLGPDCVWDTVYAEAQRDADAEPMLRSFLYASVLGHRSFEQALCFILANRLASPTLLTTQLVDIFAHVLEADTAMRGAVRADLQAIRARDPACRAMAHALLFYKGYHAVQTYRMAHGLWTAGRTTLALMLQSRMSEVFAVDIHPAARIGQGILLDHGTGLVIGETAVVGDRVSLMQGVTLGGTGKEAGDRHPKIGPGVLLSANATILGNITIGEGSMVGAGSLVLKPVPPHTMCAGIPGKQIGPIVYDVEPAQAMAQDFLGGGAWETRAAAGGAKPAAAAAPPAAAAAAAVAETAAAESAGPPLPSPPPLAPAEGPDSMDGVEYFL